ncbi:hypothetical protein IFR05_005749 [Cadophora sp. M221]|nr:hypothetical protein IFR05_005749 [Cadophora sp. M221]
MPTRYSQVSDENESHERRHEETFSDIETSSTIDEKDRQQSKPRNWQRLQPFSIKILVLAIFLVVVPVSGVALRNKSMERKGPVPDLPIEAVIFGNYSDYSAAPTIENNVMWMDLLGPGMGFVSIKDPSKYGLLDGVSNPHMPANVQNYGMMIRTLYWQALRGDRNLKMAENDGLEEEMGHVNHCFDYIRQGIMCAGDMSIEGAADERDGEGPHISGVGMKHECKSWDGSRKWMDENLPAR